MTLPKLIKLALFVKYKMFKKHSGDKNMIREVNTNVRKQ